MGAEETESESHMLFECDLYADLRSKLITQLNSSPPIFVNDSQEPPLTLTIDNQSLKENIMKMLSPNSKCMRYAHLSYDKFNIHHTLTWHMNQRSVSFNKDSLVSRRSYISNCICTFILRAFEKHKRFNNDMQAHRECQNTVTFNFGINPASI